MCSCLSSSSYFHQLLLLLFSSHSSMLSERSVLPSIDESPVNGYGTLERVLRDTPQISTLERNFKMSPLAEGSVETGP